MRKTLILSLFLRELYIFIKSCKKTPIHQINKKSTVFGYLVQWIFWIKSEIINYKFPGHPFPDVF